MARTEYSTLVAEAAALDKDLQNPAASGVYQNPDYVAGGALGFSALDDIERDPHAHAVLRRERTAITSYAHSVSANGTAPIDIEAATWADALLNKINYDKITTNLLQARVYGFAVCELMFGVEDNKLTIKRVIPRAPRRFVFDKQLNLRLRTPENVWPGELMNKKKFLIYTHGGKDNNPYGEGVGSKLLAYVRIKRELFVRSSEFSERVANGSALATVKGGKDKELQSALSAAVDLVRSGVAAVSDAVTVTLLEPNGSAQGVFESLINLINFEISKCVLGEVDSLTASPYKAAGVMSGAVEGIRVEQARSLSEDIDAVMNEVLAFLTEYNFPGAKSPTVSRAIGQNERFLEMVKKDHLIAQLGVAPDIAYVRANYGNHWNEAPQNRATPPAIAGMLG